MSTKLIRFLLFLTAVSCRSLVDYNIQGSVATGWESITDLFRENFENGRDTGASVAVYYKGQLVVDLHGGWFDPLRSRSYDTNTLQLVFSTTKGLVATAAALCVQRGLLNYSALVTDYWPEFGQNGKENTTVAHILSHRAGLPREPPIEEFYNWTGMIQILERLTPVWPPGSIQGYHSLTYGWLAGELIRRVDPKRRSVGQFIREEIAEPAGIELYIGLPPALEYRVSPLLLNEVQDAVDEALLVTYAAFNEHRTHQAEIPAGNGITNAKSLAKLYASLIGDVEGKPGSRLLKEDILREALKKFKDCEDEVDFILKMPSPFGMGFMLYDHEFPFLGQNTFGHSGAGGSISFAAPDKNLSFAFVMNQIKIDLALAKERILPMIEESASIIDKMQKNE